MPAISVERMIGKTGRAVLGGLVRDNDQKMRKRKYRRFALSLRDEGPIVGGVRMTVPFTRHWFAKAL